MATIRRWRRQGFGAVEAELGHLAPLLEDYEKEGIPCDLATLLLVSDIPGGRQTLEGLKDHEVATHRGKDRALDLILWELDVASYDGR